MFDYSIELQAENIYNKKTREYFQEVLSSFINGNYRSALVMLWTVTVTDLIFKLQDLESIYSDKSAGKILEEIKKSQDDNPYSPAWESKVVELIKEKKLPLFELYELTHVEALQKQRHLSAHPIIKDDVELYQPNKETVRAYIRNIMEGVLVKAPYASSKIFDVLIADIASKRDLFPDYNKLVAYIEAAYLKATPLAVIKFVFEKLWKFSFNLENSDADLNREINVRVLGVISDKYLEEIPMLVKEKSEYFSRNLVLNNESVVKIFVEYCRAYPKIYLALSEPYNHPIKEKIISDYKLHSFAPFLYEFAEEWVNVIEDEITYDRFLKCENASVEVYDYLEKHSDVESLLNSYIKEFSKSDSFNGSDSRYGKLIQPFLDKFTKDQFIEILDAIKENDQINSRRMADSTNREIRQAIEEKNLDVDFSSYNYLKKI